MLKPPPDEESPLARLLSKKIDPLRRKRKRPKRQLPPSPLKRCISAEDLLNVKLPTHFRAGRRSPPKETPRSKLHMETVRTEVLMVDDWLYRLAKAEERVEALKSLSNSPFNSDHQAANDL